jgi:hypothetical protein
MLAQAASVVAAISASKFLDRITGLAPRLEGQDTAGKILGEHRGCRCGQRRAPPSFGQGANAVENFRRIDIRGVEPAAPPPRPAPLNPGRRASAPR